MLNDRVDPPIEIEWVVTDRLDRFSRNICRDPADGVEYDVGTLDTLEVGYVCRYRNEADEVLLHLPYRVMDVLLAKQLEGIGSFRVLQPAVTLLPREAKNRKACLRDFAVSASDFRVLRRRLDSLGWLLEHDVVDVDALLGGLYNLANMVTVCMSDTSELVTRRCSGQGPRDQQELDELLTGLSRTRQMWGSAPAERMRLAKQLDQLSRESGRHSDFVRCSAEMERLGVLLDQLNQLNLDRHEREAVHLFRVNTGQDSVGSQGHLRPLSNELQDLARFHPSLRYLSADGKDLLFRLPGLVIRVSPTALVVTGDPGVLHAFLNATPHAGGDDVSDRFRLIVSRQKPTDDSEVKP